MLVGDWGILYVKINLHSLTVMVRWIGVSVCNEGRNDSTMLWTIIGAIILLWILGLVFKIAAGFIHILLIIAVILILVKVFQGIRRR